MSMKLNEVIPWGRSFEEYARLFSLTSEDLAGTILGCGDGPASFNAEATAISHRVISRGPIYTFTAAEIERHMNDKHEEQRRLILDQFTKQAVPFAEMPAHSSGP
jgi:hypothetical protein